MLSEILSVCQMSVYLFVRCMSVYLSDVCLSIQWRTEGISTGGGEFLLNKNITQK